MPSPEETPVIEAQVNQERTSDDYDAWVDTLVEIANNKTGDADVEAVENQATEAITELLGSLRASMENGTFSVTKDGVEAVDVDELYGEDGRLQLMRKALADGLPADAALKYLTRAGGLRDKVAKLLQSQPNATRRAIVAASDAYMDEQDARQAAARVVAIETAVETETDSIAHEVEVAKPEREPITVEEVEIIGETAVEATGIEDPSDGTEGSSETTLSAEQVQQAERVYETKVDRLREAIETDLQEAYGKLDEQLGSDQVLSNLITGFEQDLDEMFQNHRQFDPNAVMQNSDYIASKLNGARKGFQAFQNEAIHDLQTGISAAQRTKVSYEHEAGLIDAGYNETIVAVAEGDVEMAHKAGDIITQVRDSLDRPVAEARNAINDLTAFVGDINTRLSIVTRELYEPQPDFATAKRHYDLLVESIAANKNRFVPGGQVSSVINGASETLKRTLVDIRQ